MKNNQLTFRDLLSRYQRYTRKLARVWNNKERRDFFLRKIEQLKFKLEVIKGTSRTAIAGAAIAAGVFGATQANAQNFVLQGINPYGLVQTYYNNVPEIADLDGDGDFDILTVDSYDNFIYFQNTGTASSPSFAAPVTNPFGLSGYDNLKPALVDIDNDGDLDLFVGTYGGSIEYYQNTGTASAPAFASSSAFPFSLSGTGSYYSYGLALEFADMDNDGDFDLLLTQNYPSSAYYYQNTGTASVASFAPPIPSSSFGVTPTAYSTPTVADVDGDGDFDLFAVSYNSLTLYQNIGTTAVPVFAVGVNNPYNINLTGIGSAMGGFADLNNDGRLDFVVGTNNGDFYVYVGSGVTYSVNNLVRVCEGETASLNLTADDADNGTITVTATSSNPTVLPSNAINITGTQPNFVVSLTPSTGSGGLTSTVTLSITNGPVTLTENIRVVVESVPNLSLSANVCLGDSTVFQTQGAYVWYDAASGGTLLAATDSFATGPLSQNTTYYVATVDSFLQVDSLDINFSSFSDYSSQAGDNRPGIAVTANYLYVNGDNNIVRYTVNMTSSITLPQQDGFFSDLTSGQLYSLWNSGSNSAPEGTSLSNFVVDRLALLDDNLDTTGSFVTLSAPITVGGDYAGDDQGGIYAGEGFVAIFSGNIDSSIYIIDLPSGQVTNLGFFDFLDRSEAENWANWGFAVKSQQGEYFIYSFNRDSDKIYRKGVQSGIVETVYDFGEELTDATLVYSPWLDRLYLDWEYDVSFFAGDENTGFVDAVSQVISLEGACREEVPVVVSDISFDEIIVNETDADTTGSITLDNVAGGQAPITYLWSNGESTSSVTNLSAGTYTVTITDASGCSKTASFVVDNVVGINAINSLAANIYPNPTTGQFYVELSKAGLTQIKVVDLAGKEVATAQANGQSRINLSLGAAASGIYFVHISQGNASSVKKLVKE